MSNSKMGSLHKRGSDLILWTLINIKRPILVLEVIHANGVEPADPLIVDA